MNATPDSLPPEPAAPIPDLEHLWQFAGHGLRSSDFNTAMIHLYRGELTRSNVWRQRLDMTTNWAVITTGATLSFVFGGSNNPPEVLIINTLMILLFLFIEARRYRYYELWTYRTRILEINFFAGMLAPPFLPQSGWADKLTDSLKHPSFPIGLLEAFGRRYRRNYAVIFLVLAISWIGKTYAHPTMVTGWQHFLQRASIGPIPGWLVVTIGILFNGILISVGLFTTNLRQSQGEVLGEPPKGLGKIIERFWRATSEALEIELPHLNFINPRKELAFVITDQAQAISQVLIHDLKRGVTLLKGTGMYSGKEHGVLMCALTSRQIVTMRLLVKQVDPHAFIIVTPAQEVRGQGFQPLET